MLDNDDKKTIDKISFDQIFQALQDVIFPKFDEVNQKIDDLNSEVGSLKQDVGSLKQEVGGLKQDVGGLKQDVNDLKIMGETLDDDMTGIKMRLSGVEKKVEVLIDSSIEVKLLKNRVNRIEKAIL